MVSPARVAAAAMAQASPVRPVLGAPASSAIRPRGSPPPSASSRTARPVGSRPSGSGRAVPRLKSPGRPIRSRRAAAVGIGHASPFLRSPSRGVIGRLAPPSRTVGPRIPLCSLGRCLPLRATCRAAKVDDVAPPNLPANQLVFQDSALGQRWPRACSSRRPPEGRIGFFWGGALFLVDVEGRN